MADIESLEQALSFFPENVPLLLMLAEAHLDQFSLDEARAAYETALHVDPTNAQARVQLARLLDLEGRGSEAILRLEQLCLELPNYAPAWILRANFSFNEGRVKEAREYYERALAIDASLKNEELLKRIRQAGGNRGNDASREAISHHKGEQQTESYFEFGFEEEDLDEFFEGNEFEIEFEQSPDIDFGSVGGMEKVKEDIRMKIIYPMENRDLFEVYGRKPGGGLLLYGPSGCGKTLIGRAAAGEAKVKFFNVGMHHVLDMWIGKSEEKLHEIFELARRHAPSILFFDEVEALAADRQEMRSPVGWTLIHQFLSEIDREASKNEGVLILGATNAPWRLDPAFLRPGRFDRSIFVPPPNESARAEIVKILAKGKPVAELDSIALACKTKDFSGADLKAVFDTAIEFAISEAMHTGKIEPLSQEILLASAEKVKPATSSWFDSAKTNAARGNHNGLYDEVLRWIELGRKSQ